MPPVYYTIKAPVKGLYKEKGSKFLAFAYPVHSEEEIKEKLDELRRLYHDARHHCYAYLLGMKNPSFRAHDDGEPGHSAGDPILGQIRSFGLTNVLVVVVRYFGGTKLGVGGLVSAYKSATEDALKQAKKAEIYPTVSFEVEFSYEQTSEAERILNDFSIEYTDKTYAASCVYSGRIREEEAGRLLERLSRIPNVRHKGLS